ncbi:hypothetical protein P691DRAFT_831211 [Macrolepiota fuliginosa MF-IS2]|uniref:Uncharacterized protein n=1 Tax=Macrolepiota fuliginosa MF-IS2 TaxID=1400762 RepID=A0A9P5X7S3_9AGAR|nr:hypothetical protein P691DRAFT_831211 [Macrolepiota fuliginosa MF-IS2]
MLLLPTRNAHLINILANPRLNSLWNLSFHGSCSSIDAGNGVVQLWIDPSCELSYTSSRPGFLLDNSPSVIPGAPGRVDILEEVNHVMPVLAKEELGLAKAGKPIALADFPPTLAWVSLRNKEYSRKWSHGRSSANQCRQARTTAEQQHPCNSERCVLSAGTLCGLDMVGAAV